MPDLKVSAMTEKVVPELDDLIYLVGDPSGSPASRKAVLGNLLALEFGQVYTTGGSGTQSPGASYVLCTQIDSNGLSSSGITPDQANNKITIANTGIYLVALQISFVGNNNATTKARIYWNGVAQTHLTLQRTMGAAAAVGSASVVGVVDVTSGATDLDVRIQTTAGVFDVNELQLLVTRIAGT